MFDNFFTIIKENIILFDVFFLVFLLYFSIQCFTKGFLLSLISFLKWILALIITIILVPKFEPYVSDFVDNSYIAGIGLGITIYIISLFTLILLGKSLGKLFTYTGMGPVDKVFGFFFGIFKGYVFFVCFFSIVNWFYSSNLRARSMGLPKQLSFFQPTIFRHRFQYAVASTLLRSNLCVHSFVN